MKSVAAIRRSKLKGRGKDDALRRCEPEPRRGPPRGKSHNTNKGGEEKAVARRD